MADDKVFTMVYNNKVTRHKAWSISRLGKMAVVVAVASLALVSCGNRRQRSEVAGLVSQWMGREIVLPDSLPLSRYASGAVSMVPQPSTEYTILTYTDASSCFSCQLKSQPWKSFVAEVDSLHHGKVTFLFVYNPGRRIALVKELSRRLRMDEFSHPVWLDTLRVFESLNHVPQSIAFHTFLIDGENRIVSIGNPISNRKLHDLYLNVISGKQPSSDVFTTLSYEPSVEVGTLKMGSSHTFHVRVKNTGSVPFSLHGISTSCDCTKATASWKTLRPGKKGGIKIELTPDAYGDFVREVYIYGNLDGIECIRVVGNVI